MALALPVASSSSESESESEGEPEPIPPQVTMSRGRGRKKETIVWKHVASVPTDRRSQARGKPIVIGISAAERARETEEDVSLHAMPGGTQMLNQQVVGMNRRLPDKAKPFTLGEHMVCIGICLRCALVDGGHHELFRSMMRDDDDIAPPCFGARFKVPKTRFELWRRYVALCNYRADSTDPWKPQREFWEVYNKNRVTVLHPSWIICLDESMSAWTGRGFDGASEYKPGFCPHLSWVPRKPEPTGVEYKTACCAVSGVMIAAEAEEGKASRPNPTNINIII